MKTVTISPTYRVTIPRKLCESLGLQPGQNLQVFQYENRIELIPLRPIEQMRGFLKDIDTTVEQEPDRL
jgi:AbrB family looped-hinge helix DNA binding protein